MSRKHSQAWKDKRRQHAHDARRERRRGERKTHAETYASLTSEITELRDKAEKARDEARNKPKAGKYDEMSTAGPITTHDGRTFFLTEADEDLCEAMYERHIETDAYRRKRKRFLHEHPDLTQDDFNEQEAEEFYKSFADKMYPLYGKRQIRSGKAKVYEARHEEAINSVVNAMDDDAKETLRQLFDIIERDKEERTRNPHAGTLHYDISHEHDGEPKTSKAEETVLIDAIRESQRQHEKTQEQVREANESASQAQEQAASSTTMAERMMDEREEAQRQAEQARSSALYTWSLKRTQNTFNETPQQRQNQKGRTKDSGSHGGGSRGGQSSNVTGGREDVSSKTNPKAMLKQKNDALTKKRQALQKQIATLQKAAQRMSKNGNKNGADAIKKKIEALRKQLNALSKDGKKPKGRK